jgi:hypothetical protein
MPSTFVCSMPGGSGGWFMQETAVLEEHTPVKRMACSCGSVKIWTSRSRCTAPCMSPFPLFHHYVLKPEDRKEHLPCSKYYVPMPSCVKHNSSPRGVHGMQEVPCLQIFDKLCAVHRPNSINSPLPQKEPSVSTNGSEVPPRGCRPESSRLSASSQTAHLVLIDQSE